MVKIISPYRPGMTVRVIVTDIFKVPLIQLFHPDLPVFIGNIFRPAMRNTGYFCNNAGGGRFHPGACVESVYH